MAGEEGTVEKRVWHCAVLSARSSSAPQASPYRTTLSQGGIHAGPLALGLAMGATRVKTLEGKVVGKRMLWVHEKLPEKAKAARPMPSLTLPLTPA